MSNVSLTVTLEDGRQHVMYTPHPKQILAHENPIPNLLAVGNRGSGKSIYLRMDAHMRALSVPGCNLVLVRRTFPEVQKNHGIYLHDEMRLLGGHYHATDHIAYYPNGSRLFLSYVGSESDAVNLLGAEFLGAYFDELTMIPWEFFRKLTASVRVAGAFKEMGLVPIVRGATNPLGPSARECKQYFVDHDVDPAEDPDYNPAEWGSIRIDMEDNPHLDVVRYRKQFSGLPDHIRKAWLEGEWSDPTQLFNLRPQARNAFDESYPYHVIHELDPKLLQSSQIYRAFDMGWFPDPAYCLWIAHLGNRYVAFHEQVWYRTIVEDIAHQIKQKEEELRGTVDRPGPLWGKRIATTFCDPSMDINVDDIHTTRDKFEMRGIPMECSVNNREHVVTVVHSALTEEPYPGTPRLQILSGGCPYLVKTLPMMMADPKNPHKLANHKDDHPTITLGYFLMSSSSIPREDPLSLVERPWMKAKTQTQWILGKESVRENSR